MATRFPARLHVLLASEACVGVVIRRGPARAVCSILWDRNSDKFETGQWLRGRIYERRADLSPDGRYMIYFAMNGRWSSKSRGSWDRCFARSMAERRRSVGQRRLLEWRRALHLEHAILAERRLRPFSNAR
jgi:hypothetical protein